MEQKILIFKLIITFLLIFFSFASFAENIIKGKAKIIDGDVSQITTDLQKVLSSEYDISPQVYLLNELKLVDFSGLTSKSHIIDAIKKELKEFSNACVIIEAK